MASRLPSSAARYVRHMNAVPGWFAREDALVIAGLAALQIERGVAGDLLEIGAFQGKSAILLGHLLGAGEQLVVCDLFESQAPARPNRYEQSRWYPGLRRSQFERNYRRFHRRMPRVLQCPSSELRKWIEPQTCRLIHIDGSHLYEAVRGDASLARELLVTGGIVAFDDYLNPQALGVVAAVWEALAKTELTPLCVTGSKLYATWTPSMKVTLRDVRSWVGSMPGIALEVVDIFGHQVVSVTGAGGMVARVTEYVSGWRRAIAERFNV